MSLPVFVITFVGGTEIKVAAPDGSAAAEAAEDLCPERTVKKVEPELCG